MAIVIDDLGSGALIDTAAFGLAHEPLPSERLAAGSDVVTFSGDKLVGGPQAGLIVGRADLIGRMRRDPLARAMRPDKAALAGVALTLGLYRAGRAAGDPRLADDRNAPRGVARPRNGVHRRDRRADRHGDVDRRSEHRGWRVTARRDAAVGRAGAPDEVGDADIGGAAARDAGRDRPHRRRPGDPGPAHGAADADDRLATAVRAVIR